jgi:hypothetical protein
LNLIASILSFPNINRHSTLPKYLCISKAGATEPLPFSLTASNERNDGFRKALVPPGFIYDFGIITSIKRQYPISSALGKWSCMASYQWELVSFNSKRDWIPPVYFRNSNQQYLKNVVANASTQQ